MVATNVPLPYERHSDSGIEDSLTYGICGLDITRRIDNDQDEPTAHL